MSSSPWKVNFSVTGPCPRAAPSTLIVASAGRADIVISRFVAHPTSRPRAHSINHRMKDLRSKCARLTKPQGDVNVGPCRGQATRYETVNVARVTNPWTEMKEDPTRLLRGKNPSLYVRAFSCELE